VIPLTCRSSWRLRPVARLANHALKITLWEHIRLRGWIINSGPRKSSWLFINNCAWGRSLSEQSDLTPLWPSQLLLNTKANYAASQEIEMTGRKNTSLFSLCGGICMETLSEEQLFFHQSKLKKCILQHKILDWSLKQLKNLHNQLKHLKFQQ